MAGSVMLLDLSLSGLEGQNLDVTNFNPLYLLEWPNLHPCFHCKSTRASYVECV